MQPCSAPVTWQCLLARPYGPLFGIIPVHQMAQKKLRKPSVSHTFVTSLHKFTIADWKVTKMRSSQEVGCHCLNFHLKILFKKEEEGNYR